MPLETAEQKICREQMSPRWASALIAAGRAFCSRRKSAKQNPERIIPFQVSKERCERLFLDKTRPVPYLPKDMKNAGYLDSFTGIYMPYYEYDLEVGTSSIFGKIITESTSEYDKSDLYTIDLETDGDYCGVPFDASKYFDDEITDQSRSL